MRLCTQLQQVKSEEDVKDAYIDAPGLKGFTKGLIDIQTKEVWFGAKDTGKCSSCANALKARNASGGAAPINFGPFELAYGALTDKLQPPVFSLGFLR